MYYSSIGGGSVEHPVHVDDSDFTVNISLSANCEGTTFLLFTYPYFFFSTTPPLPSLSPTTTPFLHFCSSVFLIIFFRRAIVLLQFEFEGTCYCTRSPHWLRNHAFRLSSPVRFLFPFLFLSFLIFLSLFYLFLFIPVELRK